MEIIRTFTVPNNNEFAKQNLLELWKDDRFHEVLRQALAPGTPISFCRPSWCSSSTSPSTRTSS